MCIIQYAKTKLHERSAYEISYKLISFLFSLDKWFPTYGGRKWKMVVEKMSFKMLVRLFCIQMALMAG